jgi:uncharacterized protein YceH (UPF0502 family)
MLREKVADGLSIGFRTVDSVRTRTGRLLKEIDLAEISLVTLPALASARVHSVKSTPPRRTPAQPMKDHHVMSQKLAEIPVSDAPDQPDEMAQDRDDLCQRVTDLETNAGSYLEIASRLDKI